MCYSVTGSVRGSIVFKETQFAEIILSLNWFAGLRLFLLLKIALCITTKHRLCLDYEIPFHRMCGPLDMKIKQSRAKCISSCVRQEVYLAVNCNPSSGVCELLPEAEVCMPINNSSEFNYIHLTNCGGHNPWRTGSASSDFWQWISTNNP